MAANTSRLVVLALAMACACDAPPTEPDAGAPAVIEVQASGPLAALEAPADVLGFAGSDAPLTLFASIAKLGTRDPSRDAVAKIEERYGVRGHVDLNKPLRVAIFDPRAVVLVVGIKNRDSLLASLPAPRSSEGNLIYEVDKRTVYLSFIGESAALSESAEVVPAHRDFLAKLAGAKPGAGAAVVLQIDPKRFAAELRRLPVKSALEEMARAELLLDADKSGLRAALTLRPRARSSLAKHIAVLEKRGARVPALLAKLPDKPMLAVGASLDPDSDLAGMLSAWLLQTPTEDGSGSDHDKALAAFSAATSGELAFALHVHKKPEERVLSALIGLRDAKSARQAAHRAREVYATPKVIQAFNKLGVRLMFQPNAYMMGIAPVDMVTALETEPTAPGETLTVHRALGAGASAFFALMSSHMLLDGDLGIATFGEHARLAMAGWRMQPPSKGGVVLDKRARGSFAVLEFWPARLLGAGDGEAVVLSAAAHRGALELRLDVPKSEAARIDHALTELRTLP